MAVSKAEPATALTCAQSMVTERVIVMEKTNARYIESLAEQVGVVVIDVSFISLTRVLHAVLGAVRPGGTVVAMVKPQFEAGPKDAPKGVVRDPEVRRAAVDRVRDHARELGFSVEGEVESGLVGPSGNHEIFLHLLVPLRLPAAAGA